MATDDGSDAPTQTYEFRGEENRLIGGLAGVMRFVARFQLVVGGVMLVAAVLTALQRSWGVSLALLSQGILQVAVALWVMRAAHSFRQVVDTEGRDIEHLMGALGELKKVFTLQRALMVVVLVLAAAGTFVLALSSPGGPEQHDGAHGGPSVGEQGVR